MYSCQQHEEAEEVKVGKSVFFSYGGQEPEIDGIVTMMEQKNDSCEYVEQYLNTYGRPLWDSAVLVDFTESYLCVVPVYQKHDTEINTILLFDVFDGHAQYLTFSKHNHLSDLTNLYWMFDYCTLRALHRKPKSGFTLNYDEKSKTRGMAGTWSTKCVPFAVTEDGVVIKDMGVTCFSIYAETFIRNSGRYADYGSSRTGEEGSGEVYNPTFGGNTSDGGTASDPSYPSPSAVLAPEDLFNVSPMRAEIYDDITEICEKIGYDCMGGPLLKQLSGKYANNKINIVAGDKNKYDPITNTLSLKLGSSSNVVVHELFHAYQSACMTASEWNKSTSSIEIEAHFAQYMYMKRYNDVEYEQSGWDRTGTGVNPQYQAIDLLARHVDERGYPKEGSSELLASFRIEMTISAFKGSDDYSNCDNKGMDCSTDFTFQHLRELTKYC